MKLDLIRRDQERGEARVKYVLKCGPHYLALAELQLIVFKKKSSSSDGTEDSAAPVWSLIHLRWNKFRGARQDFVSC